MDRKSVAVMYGVKGLWTSYKPVIEFCHLELELMNGCNKEVAACLTQ